VRHIRILIDELYLEINYYKKVGRKGSLSNASATMKEILCKWLGTAARWYRYIVYK